MRFNSAIGVFMPCAADNCSACPNKSLCSNKTKLVRNKYADFLSSINTFFETGKKYYASEHSKMQEILSKEIIVGEDGSKGSLADWLKSREKAFAAAYDKVKKELPASSDDPFTIPFEKYQAIFNPIKELYWDGVVSEYLQVILKLFYKQCDSVLKGATLFERFVKSLSIADFMNNMEGSV